MPLIKADTPLRRVLDERGVRYHWFAAQLGLTKFAFSKIESGTQLPPDGYYERAAELLGVPIERILPERSEGAAA